jgi:flagellar motor switch protein FliG
MSSPSGAGGKSSPSPKDVKDSLRDKGYCKAARFLMLLGKEEAAKVLKHLNDEEVAGITGEIAQVQRIESSEAAKILEEFGYLLKTKDLIARGGVEMAEDILKKAFAPEKAQALIEKLKNRTAPHPFAFLMDLDVEQVKLLLKNESAPVLAAILPHLSPDRAAEVLRSSPEELRLAVVRRMARLREISPEVLRRAEGSLKDKIRAQGQIVTQEIDGPAVLAEILRNMRHADEQEILEKLELAEPALAADIQKKLLTLDILLVISDRDMETLLRDFSDSELALLSKALTEQQLGRIYTNLSERRRQAITAEAAELGAVLRTEADRAVQDFLDYLKMQEQQGEIRIIRDTDKVVE